MLAPLFFVVFVIELTTQALLFPAISLVLLTHLFVSYTTQRAIPPSITATNSDPTPTQRLD